MSLAVVKVDERQEEQAECCQSNYFGYCQCCHLNFRSGEYSDRYRFVGPES